MFKCNMDAGVARCVCFHPAAAASSVGSVGLCLGLLSFLGTVGFAGVSFNCFSGGPAVLSGVSVR